MALRLLVGWMTIHGYAVRWAQLARHDTSKHLVLITRDPSCYVIGSSCAMLAVASLASSLPV